MSTQNYFLFVLVSRLSPAVLTFRHHRERTSAVPFPRRISRILSIRVIIPGYLLSPSLGWIEHGLEYSGRLLAEVGYINTPTLGRFSATQGCMLPLRYNFDTVPNFWMTWVQSSYCTHYFEYQE